MDTNKSIETLQTATSPVLGSSTFKRKFMRSTNINRKSAKMKLSDKFENESVTSEKQSREYIINNTSESKKVSFVTSINSNELSNSKSEKLFLSNTNSYKPIGFQTASGKPLVSKIESSNFANELMSDIFNANIVTNKEKKYNFLSRYPSHQKFQSESNKYVEVHNLLGFDANDISFSNEINEKVRNLIDLFTNGTFSNCGTNIVNSDSISQVFHDIQERYSKKKDFGETEAPLVNKSEDLKKSDSLENSLYEFTENMLSKIEEMCPKIDKCEFSKKESVMNIATGKQLQYQKQVEIVEIIPSRDISIHTVQRIRDGELNDNMCHTKKERHKKVSGSCHPHSENESMNNQESNEGLPQSTTGSGCKMNIRSFSMQKVKDISDDFSDIKVLGNAVSELNNTENMMNEQNSQRDQSKKFEDSIEMSAPQFTTASGKKLNISSDKILKISNIFKDIQNLPLSGYFSNSTGNSDNKESKELKSNMRNIFNQDETRMKTVNKHENPNNVCSLFSTASGKTINLPSSSILGAHKIFEGYSDFEQKTISNSNKNKQCCFDEMSEKHVAETIEKFSNVGEQSNVTIHANTPEKGNDKNFITPQKPLSSRRRLGGSGSKSKNISDSALSRAKMLFGDLNFDDLKLPSHLKMESPGMSANCNFTPIKLSTVNVPRITSTPVLMRRKNDSFLTDIPAESNHPFVIQKPTTKNLTELAEDLNIQQSILEKKLEFISKKKDAIQSQISAQTSNKRFKLDPQEKKNKINLKDVKNLEMQSDYMQNTDAVILQINPQNASLIHFNNNWIEVPTVTTDDGCILVPNSQGFIGLSEVEPAFTSMFGIEKKLIPDGWIKNHYRWIIWKLASYERVFPATLGGCLNINNVIKQLKYRYNREIYNAERPALRKIYEMDDSPQKRMALCISNIIKNGDNTELELTDGWYSIQTIIDDPLIRQINKQKIKIGSKLIITGAELMNCEGCHPLEFEQSRKVRLKIHFNSTRRAAWFSKLGYQKDPSPLSIKLRSAVWNGGTIGKITVYIMRVYPVIFREKTDFSVFWRNQNAEIKKIQEFENEYMNKYEQGDNLDIIRRNVSCLLQIAVIDISEDDPKPFRCTIWDASESHQEQLRENQIVSFYNVTLRSNGELNCNKKSFFQICEHRPVQYEKYRRKYVELSSFSIMSENSIFGEFDTVGFLLKKSIEENGQHFWITDLTKKFLLVIISAGPTSCLLLNKVEESNLVAVCNLKLKDDHGVYVVASGSFQTIITQYPQHSFLRDKMEELRQKTENELFALMDEQKKVLEQFENGKKHKYSSESGNTLNFSRATSTDAVMSMINLEEIFENQKQ